MAVGFIAGSAGSGKSTALYQEVIEQAVKHPRKRYLIIVPEQFTLSTQRRLVRLHPRHVIMNIDVLSFDRMAYRIFDELGTDTLQVLEDTGKHLLLRKVAQEQEENMGVLRINMKRAGYITQMKSLLSELMQYGISPDELDEMLLRPDMDEAFSRKVRDILVMYRGFCEKLEGHYITAEEILQQLTDVIRDSAMIAGATLVFDGFTGFTPVQYQLLRICMPLTERMLFTVTIDPSQSLFSEVREEELFAMSKEMVRRIRRLAEETKTPLEDVVFLRGSARFLPGGRLAHLEKELFRPGARPYRAAGDEAGGGEDGERDEFRICSMKDPRQELEYAAGEIERQVREEGRRYREFAVVCADMERYAYLAPGIFGRYHIPFFLDAKTQIVFHPFVEYVTGVFSLAEENFSYESVMHYLRTGLSGLEAGEIDLLENYVLAAGIRGKKRYRERFAILPRSYTAEDLVELDRIREKFYRPLEVFFQALKQKPLTVRGVSEALYRLLEERRIEEQLDERARRFREEQEESRAAQEEQVFGLAMDLLDKMVSILGDEEITPAEYAEMLSAGLEAETIGVVPPGSDQVMIGDMERSRLDQIRVLYLLGVNDGAIPKAQGHGGIISQADRERIRQAGYEVAPTDRERAFMQRFYFYLIVTKPSRKLIVTYARVDNEGKTLRPSYVIAALQKLFPDRETEVFSELPEKNRLLTREAAGSFYAEELRRYVRWGEASAALPLLVRLEKEERSGRTGGPDLMEAAFYEHRKETLSAEAVDALFGAHMRASVSRMEQYARCAYAYFLRYGLKLLPRQEYAFEAADMGTLYHQALEKYSRLLEERQDADWFTVSEQLSGELLSEAVLLTYQEMEKTRLLEDARDRYRLNAMEKTLRQTVWALQEQIRKGDFIPARFEVDFKEAGESDALTFPLDGGHDLRLYGKVDRVDLWETAEKICVKIVDYKSGAKDLDATLFYYGLQVQLILYMKAVTEGLKKNGSGKDIEPGALFYYRIARPLIAADEADKDGGALLKALRMRGVVNADDRVIDALHRGLEGSSDVIPVGRKSDGTLRADSRTLDREQIELMEDYGRLLVEKIGRSLLRGEVDCRPYQLGEQTGCDHCEFHGVCGFDAGLDGYGFLPLKRMGSWEEAVEKMKEDIEKDRSSEGKEGGR